MALFKYKAFVGKKKHSGLINSDSYVLAKKKLQDQNFVIVSLYEVQNQKVKLDGKSLFSFTSEIAQLLKAGLPIYEALLIIEEKYRGQKVHSLFLDLCDSLKNGYKLSVALSKYSETFDSTYISMISSAEKTGSLESAYEKLAILIGRQQKLKRKIISAISYPAFLFLFCLGVVFIILFFVVPSLKDLFEGRSLNTITYIVIGLSDFLRSNIQLLVCFFVFGVVGLFFFFRRPRVKVVLHRFFLSLPLIKTIALDASLMRFCDTFSVLLLGGIPLLESLKISKTVIRNGVIENIIEKVSKKISEGSKLSVELSQHPIIPSLIVRALATAEEAGGMPNILNNVAKIYEDDLEKNFAQITTFLQPILLIVLGGIIALVILSILLPLTDLSSLGGF